MMDTIVALLPEDEVPGSLVLGLFQSKLPIKMRDHQVSKEFKNPDEMVLHGDKIWDAWRAQPLNPLLDTATTTHSSPSRGRVWDRGSCNQTLCPLSSRECYFHK